MPIRSHRPPTSWQAAQAAVTIPVIAAVASVNISGLASARGHEFAAG
jgi:hypothetical protein